MTKAMDAERRRTATRRAGGDGRVRVRRRGRGRSAEAPREAKAASLEGVDERDADAVNRLLAVVPGPATPGDARGVEPPTARTPYRVKRAFVAAAEAALKAIEEAEANVDAQRAYLASDANQPTGGDAGELKLHEIDAGDDNGSAATAAATGLPGLVGRRRATRRLRRSRPS